MAELVTKSANIRMSDADKKSVASINNVLPTVTAEKAAAFVNGIETLRNNGACSAQMRVGYDITQ